MKDAALDDWVRVLIAFPSEVIDRACERYMNNQPRRRPTPGDIRAMCMGQVENRDKNRSNIPLDDLRLLEEKILPTARKWLGIPGLADHGRATLDYWGER